MEIQGSLDSLRLYRYDMGPYIKLSKEDQIELGRRIKNGDCEAREILITANLRLVLKIANKYLLSNFSREDLIQEGNIGLIKAVDNYNPNYSCAFSTYATKLIEQSIFTFVNENKSLIHINYATVLDMDKIRKTRIYLFEKNNCEPTISEIANELHMSEQRVKELLSESSQSIISFSTPICDSNKSSTLGDMISDKNFSIDKIIDNLTNKQAAERLLDALSSRQREILRKYYGINQNRLSMKQLAEEFGLTAERISQIIDDAIDRILKSRILDQYVNLSENPTKYAELLTLYREKYRNSKPLNIRGINEDDLSSYEKSDKNSNQLESHDGTVEKSSSILKNPAINNLSYFDKLMLSKRATRRRKLIIKN